MENIWGYFEINGERFPVQAETELDQETGDHVMILKADFLDDIFKRINTLEKSNNGSNGNGNGGGNPASVESTEWEQMLTGATYFSDSKFNSEYTETELVTLAINAPIELPDFLKSTKGKKADKVAWIKENLDELIKKTGLKI